MTSLFQVIAHEDNADQTLARQAMALATQRVNDGFDAFIKAGGVDQHSERLSLVKDDVRAVVAVVCEQVGFDDVDRVYKAVTGKWRYDANRIKSASVESMTKEAKPRMCPYHSEVTDISLASGNPEAGFNAMAQHAWTKNHCQGEGWEGGRCGFKREMVTQTYWDDRKQRAEERKLEREEQRRIEEEQGVQELAPVQELPQAEPIAEEIAPVVDEPSAIGEGVSEAPETEQPMLMAAGLKEAGELKLADGTAVPKMDKHKWTPKSVPELTGVDKADGRHPTKRKDVVSPISDEPNLPDNESWPPKEIGEQVTEHQDVTKEWDLDRGGQGGTFGGGERSAISSIPSRDAIQAALAKTRRD